MPKPLPYVRRVQQRTIVLGPPDGDQLELPQWGYLLGGEADMVSQSDHQPEVSRRTMVLANQIAAAIDRPAVTVHPSVIRMLSFLAGVKLQLTSEEEDWLLRWVDDVTALLRFQTTVGVQLRNTAVAALISHRLEGQEDFTAADAARLPEKLREQIYSFYQAEALGTTEVKTTDEQVRELEAELGKLLTEPGSPGGSTGTTLSGAVSDTAPATQTSAAKGSSASRSRTSSTRSRKALPTSESGFGGESSPSPS
jgi:hypothetical protein